MQLARLGRPSLSPTTSYPPPASISTNHHQQHSSVNCFFLSTPKSTQASLQLSASRRAASTCNSTVLHAHIGHAASQENEISHTHLSLASLGLPSQHPSHQTFIVSKPTPDGLLPGFKRFHFKTLPTIQLFLMPTELYHSHCQIHPSSSVMPMRILAFHSSCLILTSPPALSPRDTSLSTTSG